jgi:hypothetical protein
MPSFSGKEEGGRGGRGRRGVERGGEGGEGGRGREGEGGEGRERGKERDEGRGRLAFPRLGEFPEDDKDIEWELKCPILWENLQDALIQR